MLDTTESGFDESAPGRLWEGVIERACNTRTNDHVTKLFFDYIKGNHLLICLFQIKGLYSQLHHLV